MTKHIPYTYLIGWPALNKWYYGVRYAKNCNPSDLWTKYKTSSRIVKRFVQENGDPTVLEVRKKFSSVSKAQIWEQKVLKRLQVTKNAKWLNRHDSKAFDPTTVPKGENHWTKKNTVAANKWKQREGWKSRDTSKFLMPRGENHWTSKDTDAANAHRLRMNGKNNPNNLESVKEKKSKYLKENNPVFKDGVKEKISKSLLGKSRPRKICEHCQKDIADSVYTRYHGNKCQYHNTTPVNM